MIETDARGRIVIDLFTTLDGVAQAPGGPEEDPSDGFRFGGWQAPFADAAIGESVLDGIRQMDALLLGRRTYDIFAAYWPRFPETEIGRTFNRIPKYVASRDPGIRLAWEGSERIGAALAAELSGIRDRHSEVHVIGSVDLVHSLLDRRVWGASDRDELRLWVYPIVLGQGRRVFPDGSTPARLRLLAPPLTGDTGAFLLRYGALEGEPRTGTMGPA